MIYIGIPLPEELKNKLSLLQLPIESSEWIKPSDLHFTLHSLGNLTGADLKDLFDNLKHFSHPEIKIKSLQFEITRLGEVYILAGESLKGIKDKLGRLIKNQDKTPVRTLFGYLPIKNAKVHKLFLENTFGFEYSFTADSFIILERKRHFIELARYKLDAMQHPPSAM